VSREEKEKMDTFAGNAEKIVQKSF
jgi:hypothetical protein